MLVVVMTGAVLGGCVAAIARLACVVIRVDGASMRPHYESGDVVLALRQGFLSRAVRRGDVVIVRAPRPGWTPERGFDSAELIIVKRVTTPPRGRGLGADELWVQGDGPGSYDSRQFGPLGRAAVVGRVVVRLRRANRRPPAD